MSNRKKKKRNETEKNVKQTINISILTADVQLTLYIQAAQAR